MTLIEILEKNAKEFPRKPALTMRIGFRTVSFNYSKLYELSRKVARLLEKEGVGKGDKVLILAPNSPYWILVFWGATLRGAILVPLNLQSTNAFINRISTQVEPKIFFKYAYFKDRAPQDIKTYEIELLPEMIQDLDPLRFQTEVGAEDLVEIMYTSGTTGEPKGVELTHRNLSSNLEALISIILLRPRRDKMLSILPLSHIFEQMAGFLLPFSQGVEIVYAHSLAAIPKLLKEHRITKMAAVPEFLQVVFRKIEARFKDKGAGALFQKMLNFSEKLPYPLRRILFYPVQKNLGGNLDTVASGGAPLDKDLEKKWNALGIKLLQGYGLTETSPVVASNTYKHHRLGSVGKVVPGVEVSLTEDGEILVLGASVFGGYYKNKEKTREAFTEDDWFRTGDMGEFDEEGYLFIKGRKKYMIKGPGAENVYPEDIEFELNKLTGIKDSAVLGIEKGGGRIEIHAVLLLEEGFGEEAQGLIEKANHNLASYQQINNWSVWTQDDFPRSATRKVKKEEVLSWLKSRARPKPDLIRSQKAKASPVAELLSEITGTELGQIRPDTRIVSELNLDSLLRIELVTRIEEKLGKAVDESTITLHTTVLDLEEEVRRGEAAPKFKFKSWPLSPWARLLRILSQHLLIFPVARIFMRVEVNGLENLKNLELPAIFMSNHVSYLDSLAVLKAAPFKIRNKLAFAAARDVLYEQFKFAAGLVELWLNSFPFPRREGENVKSGLEYMGKLLDREYSIVIFPEGQMSPNTKLQPLKKGAGLIAREMNAWIVPVKIEGSAEILPYGKIIPRKRGIVKIKFGKPLRYSRSDSVENATKRIEEELRNLDI